MGIDAAIQELAASFGPRLSQLAAVREAHGRDESWHALHMPDAVVWPESTQEVAQIARTCHAQNCPIIPWGCGTSLEGHVIPVRGGISVDFGRMDKIRALHAEDMDIIVEPGITRKRLNEELRATGLFFPVDPGADASLGGMVSTRASGTCAVRYGTMRDAVMGLEVVLADGRIIQTGSRARKSSTGYDLSKLFVGAEGTLGMITAITLRLHGQPEAITAATCSFDNIADAVNTVITTIQSGVPIARMEFLDECVICACNRHDGSSLPEKPTLFMEFHGSPSGVAEQAEMVREITREYRGSGFEWANDQDARNRLWAARHNAYYAIKAMRPGAQGLTTDACVPISRLADCIMETRADCEASTLDASILGHAGDGNFHVVFMIDPDNEAEKNEALRLADRLSRRSLEMGGTVSGEHGIGLGKRKFMQAEHGSAWQVMADIKKTLDPAGIMNPGKMLPVS